MLSLTYAVLIDEAYDIAEWSLPSYHDIEKSDLEQLEKEILIKLAKAGFLETKNLKGILQRSNDFNSKFIIGISLLMLIQVTILSIFVLKPLNKANAADAKSHAAADAPRWAPKKRG